MVQFFKKQIMLGNKLIFKIENDVNFKIENFLKN